MIGSRIGAQLLSLCVLITHRVAMETLALSTPVVLMASVPPHPVLAVHPSQSFVGLLQALVRMTKYARLPPMSHTKFAVAVKVRQVIGIDMEVVQVTSTVNLVSVVG